MTSLRVLKLSATSRMCLAAGQKWRCAVCNELLSAFFEIDHRRALCNGGADKLENLQALCRECHAKKTHSDRFPEQYEALTGRSKYFQGGPLALL
eukprot:gnl/Hemi2/4416_TR1547_c0_g1_i1.p2 gnl/Hemi2/4416_TR1547_c0_g1~~gnl/Hemi2/4416_TR1547_c0_g1_i1.p2  ORF type:complete len:105 (-),score=14.52 gnl/Hemi2/4416_TR1547_c0_g1_i1:694-978(-)